MPRGYMSTLGIGIRYLMFTLMYTVSFQKGTLFHKTPNVSSDMSVEQTHEQNNNMVKEPRDAMGMIESHCAFTCLMVA